MSEHTPGPWSAKYSDRVVTADDVDGTKSVAHVYPCKRGNQRANQLLIAAAPDMLEALKLARDIIGHPDDTGSRFIAGAIAKAEGRS